MADTETYTHVDRPAAGAVVRDLMAAVVSGQIAGLAMLATMMIVAAARGHPILEPLRGIAAIAMGTSGFPAGPGPVLLGLVLHLFGFSLLWSLAFGFLVRFADRRHPLNVTAIGLDERYGSALYGLLVGMASNLIDVIIVMPVIAQDAAWTDTFIGFKSWIYHFVFGLGLATFPWVRQRMFGSLEG